MSKQARGPCFSTGEPARDKFASKPHWAGAGLSFVGEVPDECPLVRFPAMKTNQNISPHRRAGPNDQNRVFRDFEPQADSQMLVHHRIQAAGP